MEGVYHHYAYLYWVQYKLLSMSTEQMQARIDVLNSEKLNTDDFGEQMEIADEIHNIEMKLNGTKPTDSYIDCIGCGS